MLVLVLGASGMLGSEVVRALSQKESLFVIGTIRSNFAMFERPPISKNVKLEKLDVNNIDELTNIFIKYRPKAIINCVGVIKQLESSKDPLITIPVNALLPHRLLQLCRLIDARMIHISTDCVFSGSKGGYVESDFTDAGDLYGKSKALGEISNSGHAVTLRTSIIGHELTTNYGLVDWFLSQQHSVKGYSNAIFSGLTTNELADVISNVVLPKQELNGLYHVASTPINKYELLKIVSAQYSKDIEIVPDHEVKIDRSLDASKFNAATGYQAPSWPELVRVMWKSSKYCLNSTAE